MSTLALNLDMFSIDELAEKVQSAETRIRDHVKETPLLPTLLCGARTKHRAHLKLENEQFTGSFKARGSLNKVMSAIASGQKIITASTGNHGLGVARALQLTHMQGTIFLPRTAKKSKVERLMNAGADVQFVDGSPLDTELTAKRIAKQSGAIWVSPYNDVEVLAGQGTIGIELLRQLPTLGRIFITVGGGGLISGIAGIMKHLKPEVQIVGCLPANSPEMYLSVREGHVVHLEEELPTLSDGSAGGAEDDAITFPICRELVDDWILASEEEIAEAMRLAHRCHDLKIEGSAGVALAACLKSDERPGDVIVLCGGNIDDDIFNSVISSGR